MRQAGWCGLAVLTFAATALMLCACDPSYGVIRDAQIDHVPPPDCVEAVIRSMPQVAEVHYTFRDETQQRGWDSHPVRFLSYIFNFRGPDHVHGILWIDDPDYQGNVRFSISDEMIRRKPPQEEIDATRPVMRTIEEAVEKKCGLVGLQAHIVERCSGESCPPLP